MSRGASDKSRRAGDMYESASEKSGSAGDKSESACPNSASPSDKSGSSGTKSEIADDQPRSTSTESGTTSHHHRGVWEKSHHWECSWCTSKSYSLLIVQWLSKLMYARCISISVSMYIYIYPSTHDISAVAAPSASEQFELRLQMTIKCTQRYTLRVWLSRFGNGVGGRNQGY